MLSYGVCFNVELIVYCLVMSLKNIIITWMFHVHNLVRQTLNLKNKFESQLG
jgi:hypothetical protein